MPSAGRRGSHRGYFVRHYAPVPGYTPIPPPLGWGSTPVRGQPHTSIKERIREPPPLAQKSWRRFCGEGLYASLGWLTDPALMMAGVYEGVKLKAGPNMSGRRKRSEPGS
jgi:hypothetical protein